VTALRTVMRRHPAGVVVVTTLDPAGTPAGLTVSSFTPVSLDPPLVALFVGEQASARPALQSAPGFAVNILGSGQAEIAVRFATTGLDRFAGLDWYPGPGGWPRLPGALSWLVCTTTLIQPAGDHLLLLGEVSYAEAGPADHPLVHHEGQLVEFKHPQPARAA
jgi:flavin reductase (DIM6/NTAB) family NADH-FMN oxidoreductase RutF